MRIVFVTHNQLGLACLEELVDLGADIQAVYTRERREDISDQIGFEEFTTRTVTPLHRVESVNTDSIKSQIREYSPELLFVVGWSRLVDQEVCDIASVATLGMHPAPLPRGRGRAPLAWSLLKSLDETALSLFHLVAEADAGDVVGQQPIPITIEDDAESLYKKMVVAGRDLIQQYYPQFVAGSAPRTPQEDAKATWWPKREPHHGLIDWNQSPAELYDWIRGQTHPYPGAFSYLGGQKVTIWAANPPTDETAFARPGEILYAENDCVGVGAWEGVIEITEVETADGDPVPASALLSDLDAEVGDRFDTARNRLQ
jgi:methionyl-tRNA formyltransferase